MEPTCFNGGLKTSRVYRFGSTYPTHDACSWTHKGLDREKDVPGKTLCAIIFRQLWLVLGVKLMEINSNLFCRYLAILLVPFLGWLYSYISDPLKWLSDLQIRDQKVTLNHLVYNSSSWRFFLSYPYPPPNQPKPWKLMGWKASDFSLKGAEAAYFQGCSLAVGFKECTGSPSTSKNHGRSTYPHVRYPRWEIKP